MSLIKIVCFIDDPNVTSFLPIQTKLEEMTTVGRSLYNFFFRRSSTYALTILVGAVFFERAFDHSVDSLWERMNRGVRRFYKERTIVAFNLDF